MTEVVARIFTHSLDVRGSIFIVSRSTEEISVEPLPGMTTDPVIAGYVGFDDELSVAGSWNSHQWYADGVAIDGANDPTYVIRARDLDKLITVALGHSGSIVYAQPVGPVVPLDIEKVDDAGDLIARYDFQDLSTMWQDLARTTPAAVNQIVAYVDEATGKTARDLSVASGNEPTLRYDATLERYYLETATSASPARALRSSNNLTLTEPVTITASGAKLDLGSGPLASIGTGPTNTAGLRNFGSAWRFTSRVQTTGNPAVTGTATGSAYPMGSSPDEVMAALQVAITETHIQGSWNGSEWGEDAYVGGTSFTTFANSRIGLFTEATTGAGADGRRCSSLTITNGDKDSAYAPYLAMLAKHDAGILAFEYPDEVDIIAAVGASNNNGRGDQALSVPGDIDKCFVYCDAADGSSTGSASYAKDPVKAGNFEYSDTAETGSPIPAFVRTFTGQTDRTACYINGGADGAGYCSGSNTGGDADWSVDGVLTALWVAKVARGCKWWEDRGATVTLRFVHPGSGMEADEFAGKTTAEIKDAILDPVDGFAVRAREDLGTALEAVGCSAALVAQAATVEFVWTMVQPSPNNDYDQAIPAIQQICDENDDHHLVCGDLDLIGTYGAGVAFNVDGDHMAQVSLNDVGEEGGTNAGLLAA